MLRNIGTSIYFKKHSLLIWNSTLTGCPIFYLATWPKRLGCYACRERVSWQRRMAPGKNRLRSRTQLHVPINFLALWFCHLYTWNEELMGFSSGLQAEKKKQTTHPHLWLVAGSWDTLSGHWRVKGSCLGRGFGHSYPCPAFPAVKEPSKTPLWAQGKQILMSRVMHNWSPTGYTNVLIYWYQKHTHSLEFGVHPWD